MRRLPPRSTRTDTLFPYPTLFRAALGRVHFAKGIEHQAAIVPAHAPARVRAISSSMPRVFRNWSPGLLYRLAVAAQMPSSAYGVPAEIGRASCRESVCQYGYIWVGAVSIKKKNPKRDQQTTD